MSDKMTCVFPTNVRTLDFNPHQANTPFGKAEIVSVGDISAERDALKTEVERLRSEREDLRRIWQAECNNPSGRFEDRAIFYNMFSRAISD